MNIFEKIRKNPRDFQLYVRKNPIYYYEIPFSFGIGKQLNLKIAAIQDLNRKNQILIMNNKINKESLNEFLEFVGSIDCIHTTVDIDEITEERLKNAKDDENIKKIMYNKSASTEHRKDKLDYIDFYEQFASIITFIHGIEDLGIKQILGMRYNDDIGLSVFDDIFINHFFRALNIAVEYELETHEDIYMTILYDFFEDLTKNREWFISRIPLLQERYHFIDKLNKSTEFRELFATRISKIFYAIEEVYYDYTKKHDKHKNTYIVHIYDEIAKKLNCPKKLSLCKDLSDIYSSNPIKSYKKEIIQYFN